VKDDQNQLADKLAELTTKNTAEVVKEINTQTIAELLAVHYQKSYEVTSDHWRQRNRIFLILVGVIGAATLLTFRESETQPLLVSWIAETLG
jgi:hypothetical protein